MPRTSLPYPYRGRPGDKRPDQGCTFRPRFRLPENTDSRSYGTSRRPYARKHLLADRLCSSIRSRGNALRLRSLHPRPPDNNATMHTRPANIHLFHVSLRKNNHRKPPMAHHPTAPDILVARLPQRSPGNRVYPHLIPRCPINRLFPVPRIIFNLQFSIKKNAPEG